MIELLALAVLVVVVVAVVVWRRRRRRPGVATLEGSRGNFPGGEGMGWRH